MSSTRKGRARMDLQLSSAGVRAGAGVRAALVAVVALGATLGCKSQLSYDGLAPALVTGGPTVRFDLLHQPLPEIPFPNDLATRPDPTSVTGLRVNAALVAPTLLEDNVRALLDQLDGWGTYAPISVAFDGAPLDVLDLYNRQNDGDTGNDAVYLIDLTTGKTSALDFNGGHFPLELVNPHGYFLNDPNTAVTNLVFPVSGPLANFLHPFDPGYASAHGGVPQQSDDLLEFYERSTSTLILRPILPLLPERAYAVVLTDRLKDTSGKPVTSPFTGINHVAQTKQLQGLPALLPAGLDLSHVAFAWAFTTESTTRELEAIRAGLNPDVEGDYGSGPLSLLAVRFPVIGTQTDAAGNVTKTSTIQLLPSMPPTEVNPYILPSAKLIELIGDPEVASLITGGGPAEVAALQATLEYVDYFVSGTFTSPDFLADPDRPVGDAAFQVDLSQGTARAQSARIPFFIAVPKTDLAHGHQAPFPTVLTFHSYKSARLEQVIGFGGTFAKYGLASISIDAYGHGLGLDPTLEALARAVFASHGLSEFADAAFTTRARDLDNDGILDPGGDFWTADSFHTRDTVRQSIVDWLQVSRLLRSFDGVGTMSVALPSPVDPTLTLTENWLTGDFNHDGIPDLGGPAVFPAKFTSTDGTVTYLKGEVNPGADQFAFGISLGGVLAGLLPALEPNVRAVVTASGAGGLADVGIRSDESSVRAAVFLELFGPLLATCQWSVSDKACDGANPTPSLVWNVLDVNNEARVPIAPLTLQPGDLVTACNLTQAIGLVPGDAELVAQPPDTCRQAAADASGNLRLPLSADGPFTLATETPQPVGLPAKVAVSIVRPGDRVRVLISRAATPGAAPEVLDSFGYASTFYGINYAVGDPLQALNRGYGHDRNEPEIRRLLALSQTILEPADPINYAPHWFLDPLAARQGQPANVIVIPTSGDPWVPTATGVSMARAAGIIELTTPDPVYGKTMDQVLIESGAVEGVSRLQRYNSQTVGPFALLGPHLICNPGDDCTGTSLADVSGLACDDQGMNCTDGLQAPRLSPALRTQLQRVTHRPDGSVAGVSMLEIPLLNREGQHGFLNPQPGKPFDIDQYLANQAGYYFLTRGQTISFDKCQADLNSCPWNDYPPAP
jgi:hypothetical protein